MMPPRCDTRSCLYGRLGARAGAGCPAPGGPAFFQGPACDQQRQGDPLRGLLHLVAR